MKTKIFGILILMEAVFMLVSCGVSLYYHQICGDDDLPALGWSTLITLGIGSLLTLMGGRTEATKLSRKDSFLIVALVWVVFSFLGMLPFIFYGTTETLGGAFFETMSGFTTTGASVLNNINDQPHGILFWRSIIQWLGGLGIVVFSFALIPAYELKNTQIFSAEVTGLDVDKLRPKIGDTARRLLLIYIFITLLCTIAYWIGPMNFFDAVCHAMTTIATGGYGTHQNSLAYFDSPYIEYVCSFFMLLAGVNFSLYYYLSIGKRRTVFKNEELRWYIYYTVGMVVLFVGLFYYGNYVQQTDPGQYSSLPQGAEETFRTALFHVSTLITSTGFQASNGDFLDEIEIKWNPVSAGVWYWRLFWFTDKEEARAALTEASTNGFYKTEETVGVQNSGKLSFTASSYTHSFTFDGDGSEIQLSSDMTLKLLMHITPDVFLSRTMSYMKDFDAIL